MNRTTKRIVAIGTPLAAIAATGVALASWTANGSGSGSASAYTAVSSSFSGGTGSADMYPGAYGAIKFHASNDNPYALTFTKVTALSIVVTKNASTGTCASSDFTLPTPNGNAISTANPYTLPASFDVPVNGTDVTLDSTENLLQMKSTAGDGCQGASVEVDFTATTPGS